MARVTHMSWLCWLQTRGPSHVWGWLPRWLAPDVAIRPPPVDIDAPAEAVWQTLLDFEHYSEWNPFHRKVEVVARGVSEDDEERAVRMTVKMGPLLGTVVSAETLCYVDSERHILIYR